MLTNHPRSNPARNVKVMFSLSVQSYNSKAAHWDSLVEQWNAEVLTPSSHTAIIPCFYMLIRFQVKVVNEASHLKVDLLSKRRLEIAITQGTFHASLCCVV